MSILYESVESTSNHVIILGKKNEYNEPDKIIIIAKEYPFNTITNLELKGYKILYETLATHIKVMD